jgi:hypothetical protein
MIALLFVVKGAAEYIGRVNGNVMTGTISSGGSWKATRVRN